MNVLLDTNILLDFILEREPHVNYAEQIFEMAKHSALHLFMTATTVTDVFYIARKEKGKAQTLELIEDLLNCVEVVSVDKTVILNALRSELTDFEDAVQECAATQAGIDTIITRNESDFKPSNLVILGSEMFVTLYGKHSNESA
ncbi:PIN domain-containing protein [candidate division KSB1 bacterium]|nr:PIN domain-containing protein [candidate division KSB1 bacterium]